MISLKKAVEFHGHLGPYLVLGVLAGDLALKKLKCNKYFGLEVKVYGASKKPKSCLIDGLQLSTGATFGKGNIYKFDGRIIKILFCNPRNHKKITVFLKKDIIKKIDALKSHVESEVFARELFKTDYKKSFIIE
ncbi:MAG: formylmethanofuran dehydrogenase subunit E family protein [Candidatus Omnitrophica bacterium]|nr:formylmethanofuran dehydrogenase subunit E family protein [Candidatus Omnitrophota bacterium]